MRTFSVAHTFKAEEDVELTVKKGEVVEAVDNTIQDGWIKVQVCSDASRHGFVPMSYLREDTPSSHKKESNRDVAKSSPSREAAEKTPRRPTAQHTTSKTPLGASPVADTAAAPDVSSVRGSPYHASPAKVVSPPRLEEPRSEPAPLAPTTLTPAQASNGPVSRILLKSPDAVVDSFMKNEIYFKQLMRKRAEAITSMQNSLEEAMTQVAECKDRNAALARKLRDLDQAIDREHRRWEDRVGEEKDYISRSLTYASGNLLALEADDRSGRLSPSRELGALDML